MSDHEELIAEIVKTLKADEEAAGNIRFRLERTRSLHCFYAKRLPPGKQQQKARSLARALWKARSLSREIEPLFGGMLDESVDYDFSRGYVAYQWFLTQGIKIADELAAAVIIPQGQKPRDAGKFLAKRLATELSPAADVDRIATLIYEFLTGGRDADISEPADAYAPLPLKTRRLTMKK